MLKKAQEEHERIESELSKKQEKCNEEETYYKTALDLAKSSISSTQKYRFE